MRRAGALLILLALAGCGTNIKGPKAYRVWCATEQRFLSEWLESQEEAQKIEQQHLQQWPLHIVRINEAALADVADRVQK